MRRRQPRAPCRSPAAVAHRRENAARAVRARRVDRAAADRRRLRLGPQRKRQQRDLLVEHELELLRHLGDFGVGAVEAVAVGKHEAHVGREKVDRAIPRRVQVLADCAEVHRLGHDLVVVAQLGRRRRVDRVEERERERDVLLRHELFENALGRLLVRVDRLEALARGLVARDVAGDAQLALERGLEAPRQLRDLVVLAVERVAVGNDQAEVGHKLVDRVVLAVHELDVHGVQVHRARHYRAVLLQVAVVGADGFKERPVDITIALGRQLLQHARTDTSVSLAHARVAARGKRRDCDRRHARRRTLRQRGWGRERMGRRGRAHVLLHEHALLLLLPLQVVALLP
eukprot:Unigene7131_Nuclearia_a/m.21879 Unigene7131_Nuclearia_a/g.21879  ORF Unigene7131_Nuclearia_a/g.21879 Unigene7131_Nuclearia_a/m.21879 type:complete len:344 (+) Unigene7131_Nuclearia_a:189-1220(+)